MSTDDQKHMDVMGLYRGDSEAGPPEHAFQKLAQITLPDLEAMWRETGTQPYAWTTPYDIRHRSTPYPMLYEIQSYVAYNYECHYDEVPELLKDSTKALRVVQSEPAKRALSVLIEISSRQAKLGQGITFMSFLIAWPPQTGIRPGLPKVSEGISASEYKIQFMTAHHRAALLELIARNSFRLGHFKLSSGGASDYYVDCRTTTLHAEGGRLTGLAILDLLHEHKITPQAVGGLTMGADPIVSNVATASAYYALGQRRPELGKPGAPLIHGILVRKAEKAHGTGRRLEGFYSEHASVIIVDDVCTTGASTINAIEAAREAGLNILAGICLVEREEANGRPAVEAALQGAPFFRLFTASDVRAEHLRLFPQQAV